MQYDFSWNSWNPNVNFFKINAIKKPFKDLFNVNEALVSLFELLKCDSRLILCKRPFLKKSWLQREIWCLTHFLFWSENITYLAGQEREQQLQKTEIPRISKQLSDLLYRARLNFNVCSKFCSDFNFRHFSPFLETRNFADRKSSGAWLPVNFWLLDFAFGLRLNFSE